MKSTLLQTCHNQLTPYLDHDWAIGLSGGCDSVVLYHLIKSAFPQKPLTVIHINHQVQKQANEWETFCENLVTCTDDRFYARRIECTKESEEHFREKRFEAFELQLLELKENCILLLAHHADDQKETVLWRFLRGTPPPGLLGIQPVQHFKGNQLKWTIIRPLLQHSRQEIEEYGQEQKLQWVTDPSNSNTKYTRNALRQFLRSNPTIECMLFTHERLNDYHELFLKLSEPFISKRRHISLSALAHFSAKDICVLLNLWLSNNTHPQPSWHALTIFVEQCLNQEHPLLNLNHEWTLIGSAENIYLENTIFFSEPPKEQQINSTQVEGIWGAFQWRFVAQKRNIIIRKLKPDESKKMGNLWKKHNILPHRRAYYPAFIDRDEDKILAYGDIVNNISEELTCLPNLDIVID